MQCATYSLIILVKPIGSNDIKTAFVAQAATNLMCVTSAEPYESNPCDGTYIS